MTALLAITGITSLIWACVLATRGSLFSGLVVYLIAASCLGAEAWRLEAAGLTWTADRFLLMGLVVMAVIQLRLGLLTIRPWSKAETLLVLFTGYAVASALIVRARGGGDTQMPLLMHLLNGYVIPLTVFLLARLSLCGERDVRGGYLLLIVFGAYLAATGICEMLQAWPLVFPRYIANPELGIHFGRARGPMLQSSRFGLYLIGCACVSWAWLGWYGAAGRRGRGIVIGLLPIYLVAIGCTLTRSVWLGAAASFGTVLGLTVSRRWRGALAMAAIGAALLVVTWKSEALISFRRESTAQDTRQSTYMRASFAYVSWQMFQDRPLMGFGFGQYPTRSLEYLNDRSTSLHLESIRGYVHHNSFLSVLVELGVVGLVLLVALFGCWTRDAWRLWRDIRCPPCLRATALALLAILPAYWCQMMFHDVSYSPLENSLVWLLAGVVSAAGNLPRCIDA